MSANDKSLRKHLVSLLKDDGAHVGFEGAVRNMPFELQGKRPKDADHSPWQVLEHLRIAQWDILEFSRDPKHRSPKFPEGYWPDSPKPPGKDSWEKSADGYRADLKTMIKLIENESTDLFSKIPHGDGQTVMREALILADHNSYHLGQLVLLRRLLGAWD
jgi:DinB superfamily